MISSILKNTLLAGVAAACLYGQKPDFYNQVKNGPYESKAYQFTLKTGNFSGSLASSGAKTITLNYCPFGVSGSNTQHYLYISGGVGTAEAVLITGGSCVGGAAAGGTLQFTTANAHSGAFSITSATAGMKEAFQAFRQAFPGAEDFRMNVAQGAHETYACAYFKDISVFISGAGRWLTRINAHNLNQCGISIVNTTGIGYRADVKGLGIWPSGGLFGTSVVSLYVEDYPSGGWQDLLIVEAGVALDWYNKSFGNPVFIDQIEMLNTQSVGLRMRSLTTPGQAAAVISNIYGDGVTSTLIQINGLGAGYTLTNLWLQKCAVGIDIIAGATTPVNETAISNFIVDQDAAATSQIAAIRVTGVSGVATNGITFNNGFIQTGVFGAVITNASNVSINSTRFNIRGTSAMVVLDNSSNLSFIGNNYTTVAAQVPRAFQLQNTVSGVYISDIESHYEVAVSLGEFINAGLSVSGVTVDGGRQRGFTSMVSESVPGTVNLIGVDNGKAPQSVSSTSSITLPASNSGALIAIGGTTNITRMLGGFAGRHVRLLMQGALTFNTGGTAGGDIAFALGPTINGQIVDALYNSSDSKWYLK